MEHKVKNPNKATNSIIFRNETNCDLFVRGEDYFVSGEITLEQAQALLDAHNPPASREQTVAEKLAAANLTVDELKAALGL